MRIHCERSLKERTVVLRLSSVLALSLCCLGPVGLRGQSMDGGATVTSDGGGQTVLESIAVPPTPGAPFSLTLSTEWARSMTNGGTYTIGNTRTIKRDSLGRIYEERVFLVPKGSKIPMTVSIIQIEDPVAHTYMECRPHTKVCNLHGLVIGFRSYKPSLFQSGPLGDGKAYLLHEDLGTDDILGVSVHRYRDTTTVQPGAMGNDKPMITLREFSYAKDLGLNLRSVVDAPAIGRQTFVVTQIDRTDPEPKWFTTPDGYTVRDLRDSTPPARD